MAMLIGFGAAGIYQGLQDRTQNTLNSSLQHKEQGKAYIKEGNLELALEELNYARQLNPKDREIVDLLASLQPTPASRAAQAGTVTGTATPIPTPTLTKVSQDEVLGVALAEARKAFDAKDYETALQTLEGLRRVEPGYRKAEVDDMLYTSYLSLARTYLTEERWEEAIQKFDRALSIRQNDDVALERYLAANYERGLSSWEADWKRAVESFAEVVRINPTYLDARARLYQARVSYGDYLMDQGGPCVAVDQYAEAIALGSTAQLESKHAQAVAACAVAGNNSPSANVTPGATRAPGQPTPSPAPPAGGGKYTVQVAPDMQRTTDDTASIRGRASDKLNHPLFRLQLMVSSTTKNYQRVETTDEFGQYNFDGLDPDTYILRVSSDPASSSSAVTVGRKQRAIINLSVN
jgi:tetratricopeptide (TPR) repeat protein